MLYVYNLQNLYFLPSFGHEISDKTMKDYKVDKASLSETFCQEVYQVVCEIPLGKVSTYGSIAALLGMPQCSRVGRALKQVPDNVSTPCHRVVNASGRLGSRLGRTKTNPIGRRSFFQTKWVCRPEKAPLELLRF